MNEHSAKTLFCLTVLSLCACGRRNDSQEILLCSSNCVHDLKYSKILDKEIYTLSFRLHKEYYDNRGKLGDLSYLSDVDKPVTVKLSPPEYDEVRNISVHRSHIVCTVFCASAKQNKWEITFCSDGKSRNGLYSPGEAIADFVYFLDVVRNEAVFFDAQNNEYFYKPLSEYDIPLYRSFIRGRADAIAQTGGRTHGDGLKVDAESPAPEP